jgi:hypothetical protein
LLKILGRFFIACLEIVVCGFGQRAEGLMTIGIVIFGGRVRWLETLTILRFVLFLITVSLIRLPEKSAESSAEGTIFEAFGGAAFFNGFSEGFKSGVILLMGSGVDIATPVGVVEMREGATEEALVDPLKELSFGFIFRVVGTWGGCLK